jgi:hypothetical protein
LNCGRRLRSNSIHRRLLPSSTTEVLAILKANMAKIQANTDSVNDANENMKKQLAVLDYVVEAVVAASQVQDKILQMLQGGNPLSVSIDKS